MPARNVQKARPENGHPSIESPRSGGPRVVGGSSKKPDTKTLAARILGRLAGRRLNNTDVDRPISGEMSVGQLRRALNAYRMANWGQAVDLCQHSGAISIDQHGMVRLLKVPARLFPPPPPAKRRSAGRHRSERDIAQRLGWFTTKRLERGEGIEETGEDEPRDDIKAWLAGIHAQGIRS
jgi:hypothetical protein